MKRKAITIGSLALAIALSSLQAEEPAKQQRPNIIWIISVKKIENLGTVPMFWRGLQPLAPHNLSLVPSRCRLPD